VDPRDVPANALVVGNPARRLGWSLRLWRAPDRRATAGEPAPATPDPGHELWCASCERRFAHIPDAETIAEPITLAQVAAGVVAPPPAPTSDPRRRPPSPTSSRAG
jgi:hypothetical protein